MSESELDEQIMTNDIAIKCRGERQSIMMEAMQADPKVRIQYASKYAGSSNGWKKDIGMNETFKKLDVKERRAAEEKSFTDWYSADKKRTEEYKGALPAINDAVTSRKDVTYVFSYLRETIGRIELLYAAMSVKQYEMRLPNLSDKDKASLKEQLEATNESFYKDYDPALDRKIAKSMIKLYKANVTPADLPDFYAEIDSVWNGDVDKFVDDLFDNSHFTTAEKADKAVENWAVEGSGVQEDKALKMAEDFNKLSMKFRRGRSDKYEEYAEGKKLFTKGQLEMKKGEPIYPDANFTMRLTYGLVKPYSPKDGVTYNYYTTLDGVMEKEDPENWEFVVPEKLKKIYAEKDFGRYALPDGKMPDCFIMTGDITGGNSGSPVMNAEGQLIGLAFDGNWESMSSDIIFEPSLQRCICVDIRYVLLILEKYGDAGYLLDEMKFAE